MRVLPPEVEWAGRRTSRSEHGRIARGARQGPAFGFEDHRRSLGTRLLSARGGTRLTGVWHSDGWLSESRRWLRRASHCDSNRMPPACTRALREPPASSLGALAAGHLQSKRVFLPRGPRQTYAPFAPWLRRLVTR